MNNKMFVTALVLGSLAFPALADPMPSETMSLNYEKIKAKPKPKPAATVGAKPAKINGGLNRDIIRRKALKAEEKSGAGKKSYAPRPQKGIEPDEIDRK